jgi:site-specific recombinase XerD
MAKLNLPHVNSFYDSRGKLRHVFRRKGHKRITIKGKPGDAAFMERYHALLQSTGTALATIGTSRAPAGTVDHAVIAFVKHEDFTRGLSKATQDTWRPILSRFREFATPSGRRYGQNQMRTITRQAIMAFLDGKTANAKRNLLTPLRGLLRFAISQGMLTADPTEGLKLISAGKTIGHMTWLEPQIAQYREHHALGTMARLAIELLLNIAARRHDAHLIGMQHLRDGKLSWRPHKTERATGRTLTIKIMPELQAALDAVPKGTRADGVMAFLVNDYGRPFASAAVLGNRFARWCHHAGLEPVLCADGRTRNYRAHGLRKAALRILAHHGATASQMQAISGHSSLKQLQGYLEEVEQERLAEAALAKLEIKTATASD